MKKYLLITPLLLVAELSAQEIGPANGSLVVAGGSIRDATIFERFLDLAGGRDVPIVVIPTAGGRESYDQNWRGLLRFKRLGATDLTVLHTYDREVAATDEFAAPIKKAGGVWFSGGRQWRLADSYLNTKVHEALLELLDRGGVIGGSSAGATIQGSYLARGDTKTNTIMMGDHEEGLAFLKNVAVDQHLLKRNRHFDLIEIIQARPDLLGIGLDEDTAIVVRGDRFEVIGQSYVAIYDHNRSLDSGGQFYFLAPGDRFDLKTRKAFRTRRTEEPLERVTEKSWTEK
ncbi:cyanophycinase [bacterium]|nr:cyanophycinase [bacterium]